MQNRDVEVDACRQTHADEKPLMKAECEANQPEEGDVFRCYVIWQMMMAMLHSNGQLRTEKDGDRERMSQTCAAEDY